MIGASEIEIVTVWPLKLPGGSALDQLVELMELACTFPWHLRWEDIFDVSTTKFVEEHLLKPHFVTYTTSFHVITYSAFVELC
jgi:hypothetical protein